MEIRLLSARFGQAFGEYQACAAKLLPMNYDQIRLSEVGFPAVSNSTRRPRRVWTSFWPS